MNTEHMEVHNFDIFDRFEIHPQGDENGTTVLADIGTNCAGTPKEKEARANLFAAAPDLLEALKLLQNAIHEARLLDVKKRFSLCNADAAAGKAIAKAEGRK